MGGRRDAGSSVIREVTPERESETAKEEEESSVARAGDDQTSYDSDEHSDDFFNEEEQKSRDNLTRIISGTAEALYTQGSLQNPRRSQFSSELELLIE